VSPAANQHQQQPGAASRPAAGKPTAQPMRSQNNNTVGGGGDACNASVDAVHVEELEQQVVALLERVCSFTLAWNLLFLCC